VVRVTWKGAQAYAAYCGLRLPTYAQWQTLRNEPGFAPPNGPPSANTAPQSVHEQMMGSSGTMNTFRDGARVSDGDLPPVHKGWVATAAETNRDGVADWQQIPPLPNPVHRYAWEDFDNVGFRTVRKAG
jgi:hypothetical protein